VIKRSIKICEERVNNTPMGIRASYEHDSVNISEVVLKEANEPRNEALKVFSHEKRFEESDISYKYYIREFGTPLVTEIDESEIESKKSEKKTVYKEKQYTLTTYLDIYFQ
jgi:hypothetical protein